jgi:Domain of unknown function (DUF4282)
MEEYLSFRKMITPLIIQVVFWIAVVGIVIVGVALLADGKPGQGLLTIVLGPLIARIYAEILIVIFKINDNVAAIRVVGEGRASTPAPLASTPAPHPGTSPSA